MAKLKDRQTFPPGGFMFLQPETNWSAPSNESFDVVVTKLIEHRKANPFITKQNNLSTDYESVSNELDQYNAYRMLQNPSWNHFLSDSNPSPQFKPRRLSRLVGAVAEGTKKTAAGIKVIAEWLGSGLRPVDQALADNRASRCSECPQNSDTNWIQKLDAIAAAEVKKLAEIKNDLKLETPYDKQLHNCQVCDCALNLKVWVPIAHISNETSTTVLNELSAVKTQSGKGCWVPEEMTAK